MTQLASPPSTAGRPAVGVIPRRTMIGGLLAGFSLSPLPAPALPRAMPPQARAWGVFKDRFVSGGRIIDTGNGGISHSEGQGIGLLSAAQAGDRESFDRILAWTSETLHRPFDTLHAWRYKPNTVCPVDDPNNATDGDLMIAAALFHAAVRWDDQRYHDAAMALARDMRRLLVTETPRGTMLLPGISGFSEHGAVTINPSYYLFPVLHQLALETGDPAWQSVSANGLALLRRARFGHWNLPPDWIALPATGDVRPSERWPARFSFDAVRVPLYLCWGGLAHEPVVDASLAFWNSQNPAAVPAWTDVRTGEMAPYAQSAGMTAIRRYVSAVRSGKDKKLVIPAVAEAADYYAGALILLVQIAVGSQTAVA